MKKIVIDISRLPKQALKRGEGIYAVNLFYALKRLKDENKYYLKRKESEYVNDFDVIHFPYFNPFFLNVSWFSNKPKIITVHDLTQIKFIKYYDVGFRGRLKWQIQKRFLKRAERIITDSKASKKDIIELTDYPKDKIDVVYLAAGDKYKKLDIPPKAEAFRRAGKIFREKYKIANKFILYVGDLNWNKNVEGLLKAFSPTTSHQPPVTDLVLTGSAFENNNLKELQEVKKLIKDLKLRDRVKLLGFVPKDDLVKLYNLALFYVQPSFWEGFGLPVLEAMKCGCPVLSSNKGSLPEVGGSAVEYFDPDKKGELADKIKALLKSRKKREKLAKKGLKQAEKFSWKKTAKETAKIYKKVLKNEN